MTPFHADNLYRHLREYVDVIDKAEASNDWKAVQELFRKLCGTVDVVIREARSATDEADKLAAEPLVYRPTRTDRPAAPLLDGYVYVYTGKVPWVCAAKELREQVWINTGAGYFQEHCAPERKTVCGKAVSYPVSERYTSGGWPRVRELCPECTVVLAKQFPEAFAGNGIS